MFECAFSFSGFSRAGLWLLSAYIAAMFLLGSYAAAAVVSLLHESSLPALIASKVVLKMTYLSFWDCSISSVNMTPGLLLFPGFPG